MISVIGILASLALPNISAVRSRASFAKNERNAQNVASLLQAARSAGATNQWMTVDSAIDDLEDSLVVKVGSEDITFGIAEFSPEDRAGLSGYLAVDTAKAIVYYTGSSTNN